jgi:hypothetical protein
VLVDADQVVPECLKRAAGIATGGGDSGFDSGFDMRFD